MGKIAEGFERGGNKQFIQFLYIAKGSTAEVRSLLCVALDLNYVDDKTFTALEVKTISVSKQIAGLIKYLQNSSFKGSKERKQS